jgi:hypothetical protein
VNERKRRIGENEAIFRSFNEEVQALSRTFTVPTASLRIVCECGARSCTERLEIAPAEYARVREDPLLFVIKPGHDLPEAETVVEKAEAYWVVQKHPGVPAAIARATAPER